MARYLLKKCVLVPLAEYGAKIIIIIIIIVVFYWQSDYFPVLTVHVPVLKLVCGIGLKLRQKPELCNISNLISF
jgi:hypothetical protein